EEPEESAAVAKPQRSRSFWLEREGCVIQLQLKEGFAQVRVVLAVEWVEAAEDHGLRPSVAGQGLFRRMGCVGDGIANGGLTDRLDTGGEEADFACLQLL